MNCPQCGSINNTVIESRIRPECVHRRRKCKDCDSRWTTRELVVKLKRGRPLGSSSDKCEMDMKVLEQIREQKRLQSSAEE